MPLSYPLINGNRSDWYSIQFFARGTQRILGLTALGYDLVKVPGKVYGASSQRVGGTRGVFDVENAFIELYKEDLQDLLSYLIGIPGGTSLGATVSDALARTNLPVAPVGFMEVRFAIQVAYQEAFAAGALNSTNLILDNLTGCQIMRVGQSHAQGSDPLKSRVELDVMYATLGGLSPLNLPSLPT